MDDQFTFLDRRKTFEQKYFENLKELDVLKSISVVDISTTDFCNRTCVFCPHHDPKVFPNRYLRMTAVGAKVIAEKLQQINYTGTIAISGFGENLLNPDVFEIITVLKNHNPEAFIECNTNGDPLNKKTVKKIFDTPLDCLNINLYDGPEQVEKFNKLLVDIPKERYTYRGHWGKEDHGIIYNNRSGVITWLGKEDLSKKGSCYYPFYKLFVDWNGDVLFCANDWGREKVIGNLLQQSLQEIWLSKEMRKVRQTLLEEGRTFSPCNNCNVHGTLVGQKSVDILSSYEKNRNNRVK